MERSRVEAFVQEFPWLARYLPNRLETIEGVSIKRVDLELCERGLLQKDESYTNDSCHHVVVRNPMESLLVLGQDGNELAKLGQVTYPPKPARWYRPWPEPYTLYFPNQTVWDRLKLMGSEVDDVGFLLSVVHLNFTVFYSERKPLFQFTIYKPPKGYKIDAWLDKQVSEERAQIQKTLVEVDTV